MELRSDGSPLGAEACWMSEAGDRDRTPEEGSAEAALVARAVAGEPAAFEQLMVQNERRVLTLAWRLLGRMDEAQDAAQEVFLKAFRYLYRFDARKPLTPWLMRITVNVCRDLGRKRQSLPTTFSAMDKPARGISRDRTGGKSSRRIGRGRAPTNVVDRARPTAEQGKSRNRAP